MRRRLAKELRQLAPWSVAAAALLFTVGPFVHLGSQIELVPVFYLVLAVFIPAARLFGAEFDHGTVERLLSQPLAREAIWREKLLALAITTGFSFGALQLARRLFFDADGWTADAVMSVVALTGGPLASIYFRQSFLGFLAALSLPAVPIWIWLSGVYLLRGDIHVGLFWVHGPPMFFYAPVAYVAARRLFLNLELERGARRSAELRGLFRARSDWALGPTARLFLKELQIQTPNLLVVAAAILIWSTLCGMALASADASWFGPLAIFAATPSALLILVFPLLLGATAVAAERQMGIADWHSSLPVSRNRQWWIKVLVVSSLAVGASVLASYLDRSLVALSEARRVFIPVAETMMWLWVLAAAVGVYASSRAREPMHALMGGVALLVVALLPATSSTALEIRGHGLTSILFPNLPGAELYLGITLPTFGLLAFAFDGFRPEPWHWQKRAGQVLRLLALTGLLLTIRFW